MVAGYGGSTIGGGGVGMGGLCVREWGSGWRVGLCMESGALYGEWSSGWRVELWIGDQYVKC